MGNWLGWVASPFARKRKREVDDLPLQPAPAPAAPQPEPEPELSPEEQAHKKKKTALPKRGLKLAHLEATEEQNKEVEDARKLWSSQLDGDRVCSIRSVSVAKWHADKGLAEVTSVKGKWNLAMGFMRDGAFWLYPEEAVYLVDQSALELYYGGVPLTFQQCVAILAQCNFSWDRYFTYAHLKRTGLVVLRSNIYRLKQERDARDRARDEAAKAAQSVAPPPIVEPPPPAAAAPAAPVPAAAGPASPPAPALASLTTNGNELSVADSLMDGAAVAALFDQQAPNASPAPAAPPVPAPEAAASPVAPAPAPAAAAAAAPGGPAPKGQGQWRNKNNKNVREGEEPRVPRELLRAEPRIPGDLAPVADIRNRDEDILRQLQVIPRVTFRESVLPNPEAPVDFASPALCVDFDVYENNNKYKKSAPGVPAYRVAVCPFTDPVPSLRVIESLTRLAYPAPLKVAVVCSGVVLFNEFVSMYGQK